MGDANLVRSRDLGEHFERKFFECSFLFSFFAVSTQCKYNISLLSYWCNNFIFTLLHVSDIHVQHVYSFGLQGPFLYVSVDHNKVQCIVNALTWNGLNLCLIHGSQPHSFIKRESVICLREPSNGYQLKSNQS